LLETLDYFLGILQTSSKATSSGSTSAALIVRHTPRSAADLVERPHLALFDITT
jgi:hypothetical protein